MNFINAELFKLFYTFLGMAIFVIFIPGCLNLFYSITDNNLPATKHITNTPIAQNPHNLITKKLLFGQHFVW